MRGQALRARFCPRGHFRASWHNLCEMAVSTDGDDRRRTILTSRRAKRGSIEPKLESEAVAASI